MADNHSEGHSAGITDSADHRPRVFWRMDVRRPAVLPLAVLFLTVAAGAWAQEGGGRLQWESFESGGVVLAFMLLALRFLHKGLTDLRAEVRSEIGSVRGDIGGLRAAMHDEVGSLRGEIGSLRGEMHEQVGSLHGEVGSLRSEIAKVTETQSAHGERLASIEAAQEATVDKLTAMESDLTDVGRLLNENGQRLAWIEGAIDRRLKPANIDAATAQPAGTVTAP